MDLGMKSQQSDLSINTSCKGCKYAIVEDIQTGCSANRLSKFKENQEAEINKESKFYSINRVCNLHNDKNSSLEEDLLNIYPSVGIVLVVKDSLEDMQKSIDSIKNIDYPKSKFAVVVQCAAKKEEVSKFVLLSHQLKAEDINNKVVFNFNNAQHIKDFDSFKYLSRSNYLMQLKAGSTIDRNYLSNINASINKDLEKILVFEDSSGNITISSKIVKSRYLDFNNYDMMESDIKKMIKGSQFYKNINEK